MPKKKALDTAKLIEMVKAETPATEIVNAVEKPYRFQR